MPNRLALYLLAVGAFAVGTDSFVITGVLPDIAGSLHVSGALAGQLITAFALVYAVSAPILAATTGSFPRRSVLVFALFLFVIANLLSAFAPTYAVLLVARIVAGVAAGLYIPTAIVIATLLAPDEWRGRSIAVVAGGMTVATALGVPIGSLIGAVGNWRLTLVLVAIIAAAALAGVSLKLPSVPRPPVVSLAVRIRVVAKFPIMQAFIANTLACAGIFGVFTYIALLTQSTTPLSGSGISLVLLVWGVAAIGGTVVGGRMSDRFNGTTSFIGSIVALAVSLGLLGLLPILVPKDSIFAAIALLILVMVSSVACWSLPPAQNHRVASLAPESPSVALWMNSSSSYLGFALGGLLGGLTLDITSAYALPWMGAGIEVAALIVVVVGAMMMRSRSSRAALNVSARAG